DDYLLLTDIQGLEDHHGEMDFKVAGTRDGITAVQLDIKPAGIPLQVLLDALEPALQARLQLLDLFEETIEAPRSEMKDYAPRYGTVLIPTELVRVLIGLNGTHKRELERKSGARLSVNADTGEVHVFAPNKQSFQEATDLIDICGREEIAVGSRQVVEVLSLKDFGAVVQLHTEEMGLLHISELSDNRQEKMEDILQVGQHIEVQCIGRDLRGNVKLSRKALIPTVSPQSNYQ
ncbi:hypothetical protein CYMTET_10435, partial [Cymbomonas tetramitiformis]